MAKSKYIHGAPKAGRMKCKPGYDWNPLANFPQNSPCFCLSGKKFKKCCRLAVMPVVESKLVRQIEKALALGHKIEIRGPTLEELKAKSEEFANKVNIGAP